MVSSSIENNERGQIEEAIERVESTLDSRQSLPPPGFYRWMLFLQVSSDVGQGAPLVASNFSSYALGFAEAPREH